MIVSFLRKILLTVVLIGGFLLSSVLLPTPAQAQTAEPPKPQYELGTVKEISQESKITPEDSAPLYTQQLVVELQKNHQRVDITYGTQLQPIRENQRLSIGTMIVVVSQVTPEGTNQYDVEQVFRLPVMGVLLVLFFGLVIVISRRQGAFSILGMIISLVILLSFIVPQILAGQNPTLIALLGCGAVTVITIYLSHGFRFESHLALGSIFLTLIAVGFLSYLAVHFANLAGLGSEEASFLQFGSTANINLQGLLLGGIMLGALGLLDDVTLAQISVVYQLKEAKPDITFGELYRRGLVVGKDHVASLVNTLILAYAGSSLPLFLLFTINQAQPAWVTLNSEIIAEEVIRTLSGSIGLVLAVPLATMVASYFAIQFVHKAKVHHHTH